MNSSYQQPDADLINKIAELQQEVREHKLVLDAFDGVEPTRKCFRMIGGVLVQRTAEAIRPDLESNIVNIEKAITSLNETVLKRRDKRALEESSSNSVKQISPSVPASAVKSSTTESNGLLA